ncbi:unnamed protein product [Closterium sp. Naga37s-1]|nr:unnamed protein product [Closterium sp. Naga37s-1]
MSLGYYGPLPRKTVKQGKGHSTFPPAPSSFPRLAFHLFLLFPQFFIYLPLTPQHPSALPSVLHLLTPHPSAPLCSSLSSPRSPLFAPPPSPLSYLFAHRSGLLFPSLNSPRSPLVPTPLSAHHPSALLISLPSFPLHLPPHYPLHSSLFPPALSASPPALSASPPALSASPPALSASPRPPTSHPISPSPTLSTIQPWSLPPPPPPPPPFPPLSPPHPSFPSNTPSGTEGAAKLSTSPPHSPLIFPPLSLHLATSPLTPLSLTPHLSLPMA